MRPSSRERKKEEKKNETYEIKLIHMCMVHHSFCL